MADDREIEEKFWKALDDSPFIMLGVEGEREGATQPMTALFEDQDCEAGVMWIFTAKDHDLTRAIGQSDRGMASYASKDHDLFASLRGTLQITDDRATVDRLWNPVIAGWYDGKDDPKLALIRFHVDDAKIWLADMEGFMTLALNKLLGRKPEAGMKDKVAEVTP